MAAVARCVLVINGPFDRSQDVTRVSRAVRVQYAQIDEVDSRRNAFVHAAGGHSRTRQNSGNVCSVPERVIATRSIRFNKINGLCHIREVRVTCDTAINDGHADTCSRHSVGLGGYHGAGNDIRFTRVSLNWLVHGDVPDIRVVGHLFDLVDRHFSNDRPQSLDFTFYFAAFFLNIVEVAGLSRCQALNNDPNFFCFGPFDNLVFDLTVELPVILAEQGSGEYQAKRDRQ